MNTRLFQIVESLLIENGGTVRAHVVRAALEESGFQVDDVARAVELLGFRVLDGFVVLPVYAS